MPHSLPGIEDLFRRFADLGADNAYVKVLAKNDNNKNQPYFSQSFEALNLLPHGELRAEKGDKGLLIYKASFAFSWLDDNLRDAVAPESKLIFYPQYPEVRFSGFIMRCETAPRELMKPRRDGYTIPRRILVMGVNSRSGHVYGYLAPEGSPVYQELTPQLQSFNLLGVLFDVGSLLPLKGGDSKTQLLRRLREIHEQEWIQSKKLDRDGIEPCNALNCGGYTLEAELGIPANSDAEPDFLGWEVKQHGVANFQDLERRLHNKGLPITLMTPEPTGGFYAENGSEQFIRTYGYADRSGIPDRINFGGRYVSGRLIRLTQMRLIVIGFNPATEMVEGDGAIALVREGEDALAAEWKFSDLLPHWSRKHAKAVYVPSNCNRSLSFAGKPDVPKELAYKYADVVRLGEGTRFEKFLKAIHEGMVFLDPGLKLENASCSSKKKKVRSQFRILSGNLPHLYDRMTIQTLP